MTTIPSRHCNIFVALRIMSLVLFVCLGCAPDYSTWDKAKIEDYASKEFRLLKVSLSEEEEGVFRGTGIAASGTIYKIEVTRTREEINASATSSGRRKDGISIKETNSVENQPVSLSPVEDISSDPPELQQDPRPTPTDHQQVQEDVRKLVNAVYLSDVDTTLEYSHPKILELLGGEDQARSTLESVYSKLKSRNMKLDSLLFPVPATFLRTDENRFAIVPTKSIFSVDGQRIESLNYQFGVQRNGTRAWKYIEGSRINKQNVRLLFPDFPEDYEFPEFYRRKL